MATNLLPVFSIITVTYNAGKTIEKTIQSVLFQSYPNVEYIVIDGASKDNTLDILQNYGNKISCIVSEPDEGLYDAMNKGMLKATGDYVGFLNAGDTFRGNDALEQIADTFVGKGVPFPDIVYGETVIVDENGKFLYMRRLSAPSHLTWKSFKRGMLVCHQAFFVRRDLVEPYDLSFRFSSDFDWCIRMMKKATIIHNTHLIFINYLKEGMTTHNHTASLKERFHIMVKYYGWVSTVLYHIWFSVRQLLY